MKKTIWLQALSDGFWHRQADRSADLRRQGKTGLGVRKRTHSSWR